MEQAQRLTLSSRAFHNDKFPILAKMLTTMFGYEMMLPMNTGAEGVETALKLARKWGYEKKGIAKDEVCSLERKSLALGLTGIIPVVPLVLTRFSLN